jgi:maltose alpha-D-glucosyltransferase/alpha-amylase
MLIEMNDNHVTSLASDPLCRLPLVRDILPQYLMARRWYASKEDTAPSVTIEEWLAVPDLADAIILLLSVKAKTAETTSSYFFPIRTVWACERPVTGVVCELRAGPAGGWLVDGFSDDGFVRAILEGIRQAERQSQTGTGLAFYRSPIFNQEADFEQIEIGRSGAEQSNTSVIAGDVILKAYRKLEPGVHPELEVGRFLTDVAQLRNVPKLLGSIEHVSSSGERTALCILQSLVRNGKDGWKHTTEHLNRLSREGEASQDSEHDLVTLAGTMGKTTAELHQAFGTATDNPDFKPEPVSREWFSKWEHNLLACASSASQRVSVRIQSLPHEDRTVANSFVARKEELVTRIKALFLGSTKAMLTRLHGDFHLGQTIITKSDVFIVDFEGEPMRPLAERRGKYFPLRDVAGMLRSFEYASAAAAREAELAGNALSAARELTRQMQSSFLAAYAAEIEGCVSFPDDLIQADAVLELCIIEKALYEVLYEIANRPDWISIPIAGLLAVIDGNCCGFRSLA